MKKLLPWLVFIAGCATHSNPVAPVLPVRVAPPPVVKKSLTTHPAAPAVKTNVLTLIADFHPWLTAYTGNFQASTNLTNWITIHSFNVPASGSNGVSFTFTNVGVAKQFYRAGMSY